MQTLWIFDMDGTLYTGVDRVWEEIVKLLQGYLRDHLGLSVEVSSEEQRALRKKWHTHQTTIAYIREFDLDFDELIEATHLPILESLVVELRHGIEVIQHLPGKKVILTNSPESFAHALLKKLDIHHLFDEVHGLRADMLHAKPHAESYQRFAHHAHVIMIEDYDANLCVPHQLGWKTAWFPEIDQSHLPAFPAHVHKHITSLAELQHFIQNSHP